MCSSRVPLLFSLFFIFIFLTFSEGFFVVVVLLCFVFPLGISTAFTVYDKIKVFFFFNIFQFSLQYFPKTREIY